VVKKRKKKKRFKVRNIIILLVLFIFLGLIIYCMLKMPIKNIYIENNNIVTDNEIMDLVDIDEYPSFLLTNRFTIKEKLLANQYIDSVVIKKKFGNILEIDLIENKIIAINKDDKLIISTGDILDNIYNIYDVPLLVNDINDKDVYMFFIEQMKKVDNDILRQISEIEYSPVDVDNERFILYMSDRNIVHITLTKINKINKYNKINDKYVGKSGVIYLDCGDYVQLAT